MQLSLRIALIVITLIYLLLILRAVKYKKLKISLSIFWVLTGLILMVAIVIPHAIEAISNFLGFTLTTNMLFCITIFISFYLIFQLMIQLTKVEKQNVNLIQEISRLKERVNNIEEKESNHNKSK